jgi:heme-degrading monooxygenase HmoA
MSAITVAKQTEGVEVDAIRNADYGAAGRALTSVSTRSDACTGAATGPVTRARPGVYVRRATSDWGRGMHVRVVTFTGAKDIDAGVKFLEETVKPAMSSQKGYRGFTASADREGGVFAVLSLWDTAEDRDASEAALASSRQEAIGVIGGEMKVETFEQLVAEVGDPPPDPGSALMVTRISMDPGKIDENLAFFKSDVAPRMRASPGFRGMRNMMDRSTGEGIVGTVWSDGDARKRAADEALSRRSEGMARGVTFGEVSFREILTVDLR